MATRSFPRDPRPNGNSLAAIVKAAVASIAAVLTSWGKMPAVQTFPEYLGRKLPILLWFGIVGVGVGGAGGTILVVGSLLGLFQDTWLAARYQQRFVPASTEPYACGGRASSQASVTDGDGQEPPRHQNQV